MTEEAKIKVVLLNFEYKFGIDLREKEDKRKC